ncbi:YopX family protein [Cohnella panacarvi]|uniref:YopX family protein n=1 Tax=Cohnella panacarvi TaxID=400776 RepID=UPI00047BAD55|nr:YopX family protein [Cohnella panacarvi]
MRDIKFRGKCSDDGRWVIGNLVKTPYGLYIIPQNVFANSIPQFSVDPETVGEYTSLKDRNSKEIYEGDIVQIIEHGFDNINDIDYFEQWLINERVISHTIDEDGYIDYQYAKCNDAVVMDRFPKYWLRNESFGYEGEDLVDPERCEVIGNIHDNPELLTEGK